MILGLNLSHDSSACLMELNGNIIAAVSEERFSRIKHDTRFPSLSIQYLLQKTEPQKITKVIVGSHSKFEYINLEFINWIFRETNFIAFNAKNGYPYPPGFHNNFHIGSSEKTQTQNLKHIFTQKIKATLTLMGVNAEIIFMNHHDSHIMSSIVPSGFDRGIAVSLDGEGDGESGVVSIFKINSQGSYTIHDLVRFKNVSSLGRLYSAATHRYNFKANSHEGKLTGLAAYGKKTQACDLLTKFIHSNNGKLKVAVAKNRIQRKLLQFIDPIFQNKFYFATFQDLIDYIANYTENYPDLAYAVQSVIEEKVIEIVQYYLQITGESNLALAGGLFANVKLNQRLAELDEVKNIFIFPEMGDGGLAIGGPWKYLNNQAHLSNIEPMKNVFWGPEPVITHREDSDGQSFTDLTILSKKIASDLAEGKIIGIVRGKMEFGPRALMNRSIIADPRDKKLNQTLNKRLRRTEFMPFAPVCLEKDFSELFEEPKIKSLKSFEFMTLTCKVQKKWQNSIQAVVHTDQTARPQIIPEGANPLLELVIQEFESITNIPCLINTSFNIHEEPIILESAEALRALKDNIVDAVLVENQYFTKDPV